VPEISVIVPTKDRLSYLRQAIPMFLGHAEVKEIIIVVDGCSDGTLEYVKEISSADSRIRYFDNVQNKGLPYSRNKGMELASCEYSFTGEDDLELSTGFFATLFAHLKQTNADIISGRNIFRYENESKADAIARSDRITGASIIRKMIGVRVDIASPSDIIQPLLPAPMLGRTDVFRKIGFDPEYRGNAWREESDFQLSARESGLRLAYCPHAISFNMVIENDRGGVHSSGGMRRLRWIIKNNWRFINKHAETIAQEFGVTSRTTYIIRFTAWIAYRDLIFPKLVSVKQFILGR
jgi:glycosyltransferase involved in cell wall biosynthesis